MPLDIAESAAVCPVYSRTKNGDVNRAETGYKVRTTSTHHHQQPTRRRRGCVKSDGIPIFSVSRSVQ